MVTMSLDRNMRSRHSFDSTLWEDDTYEDESEDLPSVISNTCTRGYGHRNNK